VHGDPLGFLANVRSFTPHQACVGFKMWPSQSKLVYDAVLADPSIHKIIHQRTNYLASISSNEIARATGLSHLVSADQKKAARDMPRPLLRFDADALRRLTLRRRRQFLRTLERAKGPTLTTTHLGLVQNGPAALYDFLGLAPFTPVARHKKVNSQNILARYHTDDHALILETLEELGVPDWVSEDRESHIVTPADREAIRAAKKAARQAARRAAKQADSAKRALKRTHRGWLAKFWGR
jgi:DNA-binding MarR family transcriptional regulator